LLDNEHHTDWQSVGLPRPDYADRDRDIIARAKEEEEKRAKTAQSAASAESSHAAAPSTGPLANISQSIRRLVDFMKDTKEEVVPKATSIPPSSPPVGSGGSSSILSPLQGGGRKSYTDSGKSTLSGSLRGRAEKDVVDDALRRLTGQVEKMVDRQYVECHALAAVRLAANGFIWLLNSSARVRSLLSSSSSFLVFLPLPHSSLSCV
jgi:hypothetical protein